MSLQREGATAVSVADYLVGEILIYTSNGQYEKIVYMYLVLVKRFYRNRWYS